MDFGLTGKLGEYYLAQQYRKNSAGKSEGVRFSELAATHPKDTQPRPTAGRRAWGR